MSRSVHRPIPLWDLRDSEAYVRSVINASHLRLSADEWEELTAEGLAILAEMAARYQPRMAGHTKDGSFAGYAAAYFPRKLRAAWHRMNEHHLTRTQPDGRRRHVYADRPLSLEQVTRMEDSYFDDAAREPERLWAPPDFVPPPLAA